MLAFLVRESSQLDDYDHLLLGMLVLAITCAAALPLANSMVIYPAYTKIVVSTFEDVDPDVLERLDRIEEPLVHRDRLHLVGIADSAPYLHNGIAETLEEIWTVYNPNDKHGVTNDMTKDQLNDLIEYLKTL